MATTTQERNITGRINWKRAKRNLEMKHGLRLGILNIGTLREKEEEITLLMEQRNENILGIGPIGERRSQEKEPSIMIRYVSVVDILVASMV